KSRFIEVKWRELEYSSKEYSLDLEVSGFDRNGLLNEVLQVVNETQTQIATVSGRADKNKIAHKIGRATRLNSSHVSISYAVFCVYFSLQVLSSFPTRRSSDLNPVLLK